MNIPTKKGLMLRAASLVPRLSPLRREEPGNEANVQLFFQSGATMSNIITLPLTTQALWLSWLKRLSCKQEIAGSNPARALHLYFFSPPFFSFPIPGCGAGVYACTVRTTNECECTIYPQRRDLCYVQLFFQSGATMSNIITLPLTTQALWLSWLKRLSSKQEIAGSNPARALH